MMSSRGNAPDALAGLLALVSDPAAIKERLSQLQKAEASAAAAQEKASATMFGAQEAMTRLDSANEQLRKDREELAAGIATLNKAVARLTDREQGLHKDEKEFEAQKREAIDEYEERAAKLSALERKLAVDAAEIKRSLEFIEGGKAALDQREKFLIELAVKIDAREEEYKQKLAALRAITG